VSPSFEKEPLAEFVWLAPIAKSEGSMTRAKNPRCLHVRLHREGGADAWYEAAAARRFAVSRRLLLDLRPSTEWSVPQETKRLAAGWTARRYDRPAFPDAFNSRLPKKKLTRALDSGGESIERLYISVADEELPDDQPYSVILCAVMRVEDFEDPDKRAQADYCLQELAGLLDDEAGIVVTEPYLMSELEFSLDDERQMKRWSDFDWLSSPEPQD